MTPLITAVLPAVTDVVRRFLPEDKEKRREAEQALEASLTTHLARIDMAQIRVNETEARSRHFWVAGWRPSVAWVCVASLFYTYLVIPFAQFYFAVNGMEVDLPKLNTGEMMPILMGMLGLGAYRTYEKKLKLTR